MSIDPSNIKAIANSKVANTIAKQLWPTMLFLVVMSIIILFGSHWWSSSLKNQFSIILSYWLWFLAMMTITGFGIYVFILDARIQFNQKSQ